jgi:hypothetical protein
MEAATSPQNRALRIRVGWVASLSVRMAKATNISPRRT